MEYSIRHLVEIALRALSPGINDSFTAVNVIDHLTAGMNISFQDENAPQWLNDKDGDLRLHVKRDTDKDLIFAAFDQIRHNAAGNVHVLNHLKEKIKVMKNLCRTKEQKAGLQKQIKLIDQMVDDIPFQ